MVMRRSVCAVGVLGLAACTEPAIEMSLQLPSGAAIQGFDLSCVGSIAVSVIGNDLGDDTHPPDEVADCIDLPAAPSSFTDVQRAMSGQFSFGFPRSGLAGVQLRGLAGRCGGQGSGESVFYGGSPHTDGNDRMVIPLVPNISCDRGRTYDVRVVDVFALTTSKACAVPAGSPFVFASDIRPRLLGPEMPRMTLEWGASEVAAQMGAGRVSSYSGVADGRSCIAVGEEGMLEGGVGCVNPGAPTLCAAPGQLEVAAFPLTYAFASMEDDLIAQYGHPVFGAVWEAAPGSATKTPITGATVELADPTQGKVFYVERADGRFARLDAARGTSTEGFFVAYVRGEPTNLIVKAAGHTTQTLRVASTPDWPSTVLAVLPRL